MQRIVRDPRRAHHGLSGCNRDAGGRFSVSIQGDGDMMYAPGALWTAAKHKIPLLSVMHNNRGYHQELMHVQRLSSFRNRVANLGGDMGPIGTSIMNPDIEYHKLAESMGWWAMFQSPQRITSRPLCTSFSRCGRNASRNRNFDACRCGPLDPDGR